MAERDDDVPVRKIAPGVSGLPPKKPKGEPNAKMDADSPYARSGTYRVMPVWPEYKKGGKVQSTQNFCKGGKVLSTRSW
jgi:hypothetical protein